MNTLDYYKNNAQSFYDRTVSLDMSDQYEQFLTHLPQNAHILDAGCGIGRDSKAFLKKGYTVTAFDASPEMTCYACEETGLDVQRLRFQEINFNNMFDGVWASASLLHVPYHETRDVYCKIHQALKENGIFFATYKYGKEHMATTDRDFYNMTESTILPYLEGLFDIINVWKTTDNRSHADKSPDKAWLNFIVRKL